jgi:VWFA-related protein
MRASPGLLVFACAVAAVSAQAPAPNPQQPTFRGGINYVRVDMYATVDGRPVTDLRPDDIELREDGAPQTIKDFEYVQVRTNTPQDIRIEPNTIAESRQMAADPRARVFILFLDTLHTSIEGSARMRSTLVTFIDRLMGPEDMVAVMTPEMAASDVTFGRKTTIIEKILQREWTWGRRDRLVTPSTYVDPKEQQYERCYPEIEYKDVAKTMIARRREKLVMDAFDDLVQVLDGVRDERKGIIAISEGWQLYTRDSKLEGAAGSAPPPIPNPFEPLQRRQNGPGQSTDNELADCDADRRMLANIDDEIRLREITNLANRTNATFYTVDPRGLVVFDSSIGPDYPPDNVTDGQNLRTRLQSLRDLAEDTDGTALVNTNDLSGGLARIVADLSSYYLLGYESTNGKLDGKFRSISVRVRRPGVQVRARRGYRTLRPEEVKTSTATATARAATSAPIAVAVDPRAAFRTRSAAWTGGGATADAVWLVGEMDPATRRDAVWSGGSTAEISVASAAGERVALMQVPIGADGRFTTQLPAGTTLAAGDYVVRVRVTPKAGQSLPLSDLARLTIPAAPMPLGQPMLLRRGLSTGTRYVATADPRFQRSDRLRLELPTRTPGQASAQLLDAAGKPIPVTVAISERADDAGGFRWVVADATLAPLAAGDYAIEVTLGTAKQVTAFRVVP